jgi:hypothetical protein
MNSVEFIANINALSTSTETLFMNLLLEYFATSGQEHIGDALKSFCERCSRGDTTQLSTAARAGIASRKCAYTYIEDRTKRR